LPEIHDQLSRGLPAAQCEHGLIPRTGASEQRLVVDSVLIERAELLESIVNSMRLRLELGEALAACRQAFIVRPAEVEVPKQAALIDLVARAAAGKPRSARRALASAERD
jgi:hypothetical protein